MQPCHSAQFAARIDSRLASKISEHIVPLINENEVSVKNGDINKAGRMLANLKHDLLGVT